MQVVIVTGASRGIGYHAVQSLRRCGIHCIGVARSEEPMAMLLKADGPGNGCFHYVVGDLTDPSVQQKAIDLCIETHGRLDGIVHNAGILGPIERIANIKDMDAVISTFDLNLFAVMGLTQKAIPHLRKHHSPDNPARLVFISSLAATKPYCAWGSYGCSKAAMNMFSTCVDAEEPSIFTLALRPGIVATDMLNSVPAKGRQEMDKDDYDFFQQYVSGSSNAIRPEDTGDLIANLMAHASMDLSGKTLEWDDDLLSAYRKIT